MTKLTGAKLVAAAASLMVFGSALATASPAEATAPSVLPLQSRWRACDFSLEKWVDAVGYARGTAYLSTSGSNVSATVDMTVAQPDTRYDVRIIQTPRPSIGCAPGAPGVITGSPQTDANGYGSTTVQGPIAADATGAWILVERPSDSSQTPAEFYSSTFVAPI